MTDPKNIKPEEAKKLLIKQMEQRRERQRAYRSRAANAGRSKVNAYLSVEASQVFEHYRKASNMSVSDILSEALLCYQACGGYGVEQSIEKTPVKAPAATASPRNSTKADAIPYDKELVWKRIGELARQGIRATRIADRLSDEGYLTLKGNSKWDREVVRRILNKLDI